MLSRIINCSLYIYCGADFIYRITVFDKTDVELNMNNNIIIDGVELIAINTISSEKNGQLSFFEANRDIPFNIKRIYYITNVDKGVSRGFHAHRELKQLIFCPYGKIQIELDDGYNKHVVVLDEPDKGLLITKPIWREMLWIKKDSTLVVAASDYYDEKDYIRNYNEFLKFINESEE